MESLFDKDPSQGPPLSNYEKIASEISHLKKGKSVRQTPGQTTRKLAPIIFILVVLAFIGLYIMDPFLYAWHKYEAIHAYLYLHNYDSATATDALAATRILSEDEILALNQRKGSFQDYYPSAQAAEAEAATIVQFMDGLQNLQMNKYDQLDPLNKLRCFIFIRSGFATPTSWNCLNPVVE